MKKCTFCNELHERRGLTCSAECAAHWKQHQKVLADHQRRVEAFEAKVADYVNTRTLTPEFRREIDRRLQALQTRTGEVLLDPQTGRSLYPHHRVTRKVMKEGSRVAVTLRGVEASDGRFHPISMRARAID